MTNEKMLEKLYEIKSKLTQEQLAKKSNIKSSELNAEESVQILINSLETEIREEIFKNSKSGKDALKYAKSWQKENIKAFSKAFPKSQKALCYPNYENGYQVFADGYKAIFLTEDCYLPFEERSEQEYEQGVYPILMNKVFPDNLENLKEIELPEISLLDAYVKVEYIKRKETMKVSEAKKILATLDAENFLDIRADFLQTIMHIMPKCKAYSGRRAFFFIDDKGNKAAIMGVIPEGSANRSRTAF